MTVFARSLKGGKMPLYHIEKIEDSLEDVVEVVRCKDCKRYEPLYHEKNIGVCHLMLAYFEEDGFCSQGERKEDC